MQASKFKNGGQRVRTKRRSQDLPLTNQPSSEAVQITIAVRSARSNLPSVAIGVGGAAAPEQAAAMTLLKRRGQVPQISPCAANLLAVPSDGPAALPSSAHRGLSRRCSRKSTTEAASPVKGAKPSRPCRASYRSFKRLFGFSSWCQRFRDPEPQVPHSRSTSKWRYRHCRSAKECHCSHRH